MFFLIEPGSPGSPSSHQQESAREKRVGEVFGAQWPCAGTADGG